MVVVATEKKKKGVSRFYAKVIGKTDVNNIVIFMKEKIDKDAVITTDKWSGYKPLDKDFTNLTHI